MSCNLNTTLSTLLNTFDLLNISLTKHADPILSGFSITEMHCIECIGKIELPNAAKISRSLNITRGGISKMLKKLICKEAIEAYELEENKKEIYYRLTETGLKIFLAHEKMHKAWNDKDKEFFKQYSEQEAKLIMDFVRKYSEHLKKSLAEIEKKK